MKHSIAILIPYFGEWPEWMNFFVESCRRNASINWFLFNDAAPPENRARNVRHVRIAFDDYKSLISEALGIRVSAPNPYKLCDLRPALPYVHRDLVGKYDFVGFGDLDVIYGDIRAFYDAALLDRYDLLSSHADRVSGHLCLFRNTKEMITAFRRVPGWVKAFERPDNVTFDERALYNLFTGRRASLEAWFGRKQPRCFFHEAYSTPGATDRMRWYWKDGHLTNEFYPHHPFMYLHFMSWHSSRWFSFQSHVEAGAPAPWERLSQIVQIDWREAAKHGFMISPDGIQPIAAPTYR